MVEFFDRLLKRNPPDEEIYDEDETQRAQPVSLKNNVTELPPRTIIDLTKEVPGLRNTQFTVNLVQNQLEVDGVLLNDGIYRLEDITGFPVDPKEPFRNKTQEKLAQILLTVRYARKPDKTDLERWLVKHPELKNIATSISLSKRY